MQGRSPGPEGRPADGEWGPAPRGQSGGPAARPWCATRLCVLRPRDCFSRARGINVLSGHEKCLEGGKTQTARDGFESDGVGTRAELSEKVTCGASSEGRKEASECRSAMTMQRNSK